GVTNANKIDGLKSLRARLAKYHDKNESAKYKGSEADKKRVSAALLEISGVMDKINVEILKLEEPAKREVKVDAKTDLRRLKAEAPKLVENGKERPSEEQILEFANAIQEYYTFKLKSKDTKGFKEAEQACIDALAEDVMKATGCTNKGAIKVVIASIPEIAPDTIYGIDDTRVGHPVLINMGTDGVNKRLLFQKLWEHGLIGKEKPTPLVDSSLDDKIPDKFLGTIKNKYSFPVDDPSNHEAVRSKCVDALVKDIVKATGCKDEDAIRKVLATHNAYKPTITNDRKLIGSEYTDAISFEIDLSDDKNTDFKKKVLFQYLADAGLVKKEPNEMAEQLTDKGKDTIKALKLKLIGSRYSAVATSQWRANRAAQRENAVRDAVSICKCNVAIDIAGILHVPTPANEMAYRNTNDKFNGEHEFDSIHRVIADGIDERIINPTGVKESEKFIREANPPTISIELDKAQVDYIINKLIKLEFIQ
ncbi:MAG: hypothetical protein US89_C0023G0006, partial [Candidatus Peregrinibacteria bacterium GW2011_GWF2_38_29]